MNVNNCPTRCDYVQLYHISADSSTCVGRYPHPSSGAHSTVITTTSGTGQIVFAMSVDVEESELLTPSHEWMVANTV